MKILKLIALPLITIPLLTACSGEPEWVALYEDCKATVTAETDKINAEQSKAAANEDPQARAMRESMNTMAINMAMTACEMIKTNCENDPDGATCKAYIEQSKQRK